MNIFYTLLLIFSLSCCYAQEYQITQFSLPELSDFNAYANFVEDSDGAIWLFTQDQFGGGDVIMKYSDNTWESIPSPCDDGCFTDVVITSNDIIYMAGRSDGLFKYENETWTKILTEDTRAVFIDANSQVSVITDVGIGNLIDNQFVATNNNNLPNITNVTDKVITDENKIYVLIPASVYEYSYDNGWTLLSQISSPLELEKDINGLLLIADNFGFINTFESGDFQFNQYPDIFSPLALRDLVVDRNGIFWAAEQGTSGIRKYDGSSSQFWPMSELIPDAILLNKLFIDSKSNCWSLSNQSRDIAVLHIDDLTSNSATINLDKVEVNINPTPVDNELIITIDEAIDYEARLFDLTGRELFNGVKTKVLDCGSLQEGTYLLRILNKTTNNWIVKKVVVMH